MAKRQLLKQTDGRLLCDCWHITQIAFRGLSDVAITKSFPFPFIFVTRFSRHLYL